MKKLAKKKKSPEKSYPQMQKQTNVATVSPTNQGNAKQDNYRPLHTNQIGKHLQA